MTHTEIDPDRPQGPAVRRLQPARCCGIELRRMLRNRRTIIFTLILPGALFLIFGRHQADWNRGRRPRQRRGVHHGLDGAVRRRADRRDQRRRHGRHGAGRRAGAGSCGSPR